MDHGHAAVERLHCADVERVAQGDAVAVKEGQQGFGRLGQPHQRHLLAHSAFGQLDAIDFEHVALRIRDGRTVGIHRGKAHELVHPVKKRRGLDVFDLLSNVVNLVPAKPHLLDQEHLGQPVFPHDQSCSLLPFDGQLQGPVLLVLQEAILLKSLGHAVHRRLAHREVVTQV